MLSLILKFRKQFAVLALVITAYAGGYFTKDCSKNPCTPQTVNEKINTTEKKNTVTVRKTTKTDPKGKTTVIEEKITDNSTLAENKDTLTITSKSKYSLGTSVVLPVSDMMEGKSFKPDYRVDGAMRVYGDLWGTVGYQFGNKNVSVGVRLDF